eukprot:CAMPEP_0185597118 /NCGR_PEP_ID=MMETSP0434-20130131/81163_1 /TAXON_ID=626734 ORGANISM="Favella taraikaensis, Strain Fe Narragansett Bay" /NCGR_SAMPLE_ID=MMETSP0434 /ASSEMBLY_ACC=CAM_ASM_000379 /LENGTH=82 /DNA_ID=CAMNT_0028225755 /DNA_START=1444 /DNA_END=1692 /DNA_ORIENTATION=-
MFQSTLNAENATLNLNSMVDNRGCSGGTGVDIIAFANSDASQNDFSVPEMTPQDKSLVRVVPFKATHMHGKERDIGRSMSPV